MLLGRRLTAQLQLDLTSKSIAKSFSRTSVALPRSSYVSLTPTWLKHPTWLKQQRAREGGVLSFVIAFGGRVVGNASTLKASAETAGNIVQGRKAASLCPSTEASPPHLRICHALDADQSLPLLASTGSPSPNKSREWPLKVFCVLLCFGRLGPCCTNSPYY